MSALALPFTRAASGSLHRPGGDAYSILPDPAFDLLPGLLPERLRKAIMNAMPRVYRFFVKLAQAGELDERVTDRRIAEAAGCSERIVQYVLWALDVVAGKAGFPFINRKRAHGRRFIEFVRGFVAKGSTPAAVPPLDPPEKTSETTTTSGPSSSPDSIPQKTGGPVGTAPPELVDRARKLVPVNEERVADVVATYGAEWVGRALDAVEQHNLKAKAKGNFKVQGWGFVVQTLRNWAKEGGPPPAPPKPAPPPVKARPEEQPAEEEPPQRLTAEEVAELVRRCQSPKAADLASMARIQIRTALAEGGIPAELVATIPADLADPPKPRAP